MDAGVQSQRSDGRKVRAHTLRVSDLRVLRRWRGCPEGGGEDGVRNCREPALGAGRSRVEIQRRGPFCREAAPRHGPGHGLVDAALGRQHADGGTEEPSRSHGLSVGHGRASVRAGGLASGRPEQPTPRVVGAIALRREVRSAERIARCADRRGGRDHPSHRQDIVSSAALARPSVPRVLEPHRPDPRDSCVPSSLCGSSPSPSSSEERAHGQAS